MTRHFRRLMDIVVSAGAFLVASISYGATNGTPSTIPAAGNSVKSGDIIIWNVSKPVTLADGTATNDAPSVTKSSTTANEGAYTAADGAAAASALEIEANKLLGAAGPPASYAPESVREDYDARYSAAQKARSAVAAADVAYVAAGLTVATTQAGKIAAANKYIQSAQADVDKSTAAVAGYEKTAKDAEDKSKAASVAAKKDSKGAARLKMLEEAANTASKTLTTAKAKLSTDQLYLIAAINALETVAVSANSAPKGGTTKAAQVCFPKGSRFNVTSVIAASSTPKSTTAGSSGTAPPAGSTLAPSNTQQVSGYFESGFDPFHPWASIPANARPCDSDLPGAAAPVIAVTDRTYTFDGQTLAKSDFYREGFTWGGLVIPYKFYFKDKSIKSNSSVVGFAGYEGWFPGVSLSTIVALGGGTAPTPASSSSSTTSKSSTSSMTTNTTTLVTYTAAVGFIAAFGDGTVKAGLMFGRDYQGNAAAFPYENKTWMALSIGAGF